MSGDEKIMIKEEPGYETTSHAEANVPDVTANITQDGSCQGHKVKNEVIDEKEGVHAPLAEKYKMTHSTSTTCPVQDNLLSSDVCKHDSNGGCHEQGRVRSIGSAETVCGTSCPKVQEQNIELLTMSGRQNKDQPGTHTSDEDLHSCRWCSLSFLQKDVLDEHMKMVHSDNYLETIRCGCSQEVLHQATVNKVKKKMYKKRGRRCVQARKTKPRIKHIKDKVSKNLMKDQEMARDNCDDQSSSHDDDGNKMSSQIFFVKEENVQLGVEDSPVEIYSNSGLQSHKMIVSEEPYKCDVCCVQFTRKASIRRHKIIHTGDKPYKCDDCGLGFYRKCHVQEHSITHKRDKPHKCDVCGVGFTRRSYLQEHELGHTGQKPFKCDVCGLGFTRKTSVLNHKKIHTREQPYKCGLCNVGFNQKGHLEEHVRIHTGEKPYQCDICGKMFIRNGHLHEHKRIHTGEKPYKCEVCGVGFTHYGTLGKHKRKHSGAKPYKCDVCAAGFAHLRKLKMHVRIHIEEMPYQCHICDFRFSLPGQLKEHTRRHKALK